MLGIKAFFDSNVMSSLKISLPILKTTLSKLFPAYVIEDTENEG